jgi:hypothetical protein
MKFTPRDPEARFMRFQGWGGGVVKVPTYGLGDFAYMLKLLRAEEAAINANK